MLFGQNRIRQHQPAFHALHVKRDELRPAHIQRKLLLHGRVRQFQTVIVLQRRLLMIVQINAQIDALPRPDHILRDAEVPADRGVFPNVIPHIRIADSRISPAYSVDVVSILYAAAEAGAQECLSPEPVREEPAEIVTEPEPEPERRQSGFSKALGWLKRQIQEPPEDPDGGDLLDD